MSGEWHEVSAARRLHGLTASIAFLFLLLSIAIVGGSRADDQEYPVTAADAGRVSSPVAVPTPALAPAPKPAVKYYAPVGMMESAPIPSAPSKATLAAPIANPPVASMPAMPPPSASGSYPPFRALAPSPPVAAAPITSVEPDALARPTYTTPAIAPIDRPINDVDATDPDTQEIPQAVVHASNVPTPPKVVADLPPASNAVPDVEDLHAYMTYDRSPIAGAGPDPWAVESEEVCPLGMEMREAQRRLKTGETAGGLLILKVVKDSVAEHAGLRPYKRAGHTVLEGVAIGAAMIFPPAILAVPLIDYTQVGESYDMIIGVDGARVSNVLDFEDHMRNIQPGETVYFSVVRNGQRIQVPVPIPALSTASSP